MMTDGAGQEVNETVAAKAVEQFAELWGSGSFDCGPQDYEFMASEILAKFRSGAAQEVSPEHILRNLLAVIHRDGGHYATEHGLEKAGEDAEALVLKERVEEVSPKKPGTWPDKCLQRAFVDGAAWWEWHKGKATMWQSDRKLAEAEAVRMYGKPEGDTGELKAAIAKLDELLASDEKDINVFKQKLAGIIRASVR